MSDPIPIPSTTAPARRTEPPVVTGPAPGGARVWLARALMVAGVLAALIRGVEAWMTLGAGIALALLGLTTWGSYAKKYSRLMIQCSIVLLGFWIDLDRVVQAGLSGAAFSVGVIVVTFALRPTAPIPYWPIHLHS